LGANDLSITNTPGFTTGVKTNAVTLVRASSQGLLKTNNASLDPMTNAFTITLWFRTTTLATARSIVGKDDFSTERQFILDVSSSRLSFYLFTNAAPSTAVATLTANTFGNLSINTWYFASASWSAATGKMTVRVNNAVDTLTGVAAMPEKTSPLMFGLGNKWDGDIDEVALWNRDLTPKERDWVYNAGAGKFYPFSP
jgi:hypothetical protein